MSQPNKHDYEELTKRDKRFGDQKKTATPYKRPRKGARLKDRIEYDNDDQHDDDCSAEGGHP